MKMSALLDVNVVAHETADEVNVLLELQAPESSGAERPPASLQVVLDRSGSMSGPPLAGAKRALVDLVRRLESTDNFGLVTFDNEAQVVVASGPLGDHEAVIDAIMRVRPGGSTDLGAGYLRGLRELRRVAAAGGTLLVVSDGHVNQGMADAGEFGGVASRAARDRVVTSTLGYGRHYDETILAALSRGGNGNHVFAEDPDAASAAIAGEVDGLLDKVAQGVTLTVSLEDSVAFMRLYNDLPAHQLADGSIMIELGDLYAAESRKLLLALSVPELSSLGLATVAELELAYVELPGLVEQTVLQPIAVNVVPGDEAAGRVAHPVVRSEVLFQEAQASKKKASESFEVGDLDAGTTHLADAKARLTDALDGAPNEVAPDLARELDEVTAMEGQTRFEDTAFLSKMTRESHHRMNRKRGRTERPSGHGEGDRA
ncbi:VWA domain-containing protein [Nocardioidaceae bacterium]|nr:VWA domain-containing protein [Nocardioidaceae bacterium]